MVPKVDQLVAQARLAARDARNNLEQVPAWLHEGDKQAALLALELADVDLAMARQDVASALELARLWPAKVTK